VKSDIGSGVSLFGTPLRSVMGPFWYYACMGTVWEEALGVVWDRRLWELVWERLWDSFRNITILGHLWDVFGMCCPKSFGTWIFWENFWEPPGCLWEGFGIFLFLLVRSQPSQSWTSICVGRLGPRAPESLPSILPYIRVFSGSAANSGGPSGFTNYICCLHSSIRCSSSGCGSDCESGTFRFQVQNCDHYQARELSQR
jgi:hypothetical protein